MFSTVFVPGYVAMAQNVGGAAIGTGDGPLLNLEVPQHDYQDVVGFREGFGVQFRGKRDRDVWFHFPVPTPSVSDQDAVEWSPHPKVIRVFVLWRTSDGAVIEYVDAWDGGRAQLLHSGRLSLEGDWSGTDAAEGGWHRKVQPDKNRFEIKPAADVYYGLGISVNVRFASDSDNGIVHFMGAGADFIQ